MATWKKVIVSGSSAELAAVTSSLGVLVGTNQSITTTQANTFLTGSFTGSFKGDGANLTGVTATAVFPTSQTTPILSTTKLFSNDGGNTFVYVGQVTGSTYAGVSGDITIGTGGVAAIGSGKVTSAMIVDGTITGTDIASATVANANLVNSSITIGTTSTALGASSTTIAGLTSVTSTGFSGSFTGSLVGALTGTASFANNATSASFALTASYASNVPVTASFALTASNIFPAITNNVDNNILTATGNGIINGEGNLSFNGTLLTVTGNATVTGDLTVAGTASFTNVDNLNIRDKFILINSGSATLADSGWVTQYNAAGSGSAFYLEATSTGTFGRFAVAYDVIGTSTSLNADEFVVTARVSASAAVPANPTWGGSSNGSGNMFVNSLNGDIFIYS